MILYRCFIPDSAETRHDRREIMVLKSGGARQTYIMVLPDITEKNHPALN